MSIIVGDLHRRCWSLLVTYVVVFVERGQRKILVNYAKRQVGNKVYGGQSLAPAAEAQHVGRDSADLRVVDHPASRRPSLVSWFAHRRVA